jgi:hypothetical protein
MKRRKSYRPITIDGKKFQYRVSMRHKVVVLYDESDARLDMPFDKAGPLTDEAQQHPAGWRGKHRDGLWSKRAIAALYRDIHSKA